MNSHTLPQIAAAVCYVIRPVFLVVSMYMVAPAVLAQEAIVPEELLIGSDEILERCVIDENWIEEIEQLFSSLEMDVEVSEVDSMLKELTKVERTTMDGYIKLIFGAIELKNLEIESCVSIQRHNIKLREHTTRALAWHHTSTIIIFVVVHLIVFFGLWLTKLQFDRKDDDGVQNGGATELHIESLGVNIKSPVVGVVILIISLAFFTIYVKDIYPITPISLGASSQEKELPEDSD
jgi:hypothetical protein